MITTRYSGGGSNSDPALSLGGAASSVDVVSETITQVGGDITGLAVTQGFGNTVDPGTGGTGLEAQLAFLTGPDRLQFKPYGTTIALLDDVSNEVEIPSTGVYNIPYVSGDIAASIDVTVSSIPGGAALRTLAVARTANALFPNVTAADSRIGKTEYRCVHIRNGYAIPKTFTVYVLRQPRASDQVDIGLDPAGPGASATTIASGTTAPAGVGFTRPAAQADGLPVTLTAGQAIGLWIRRTVPPLAVVGASPDTFFLAYGD